MQKYIIKIYVFLPKIHTIMFKTFGNFYFFSQILKLPICFEHDCLKNDFFLKGEMDKLNFHFFKIALNSDILQFWAFLGRF